MGQAVHVVDPCGVSGLAASRFDPLVVVEPDSPASVDEAASLGEMLMPARFAAKDVFWRNRAMYLPSAALLGAVSDHPPGARNLVTVREIRHGMVAAGSRDGGPRRSGADLAPS